MGISECLRSLFVHYSLPHNHAEIEAGSQHVTKRRRRFRKICLQVLSSLCAYVREFRNKTAYKLNNQPIIQLILYAYAHIVTHMCPCVRYGLPIVHTHGPTQSWRKQTDVTVRERTSTWSTVYPRDDPKPRARPGAAADQPWGGYESFPINHVGTEQGTKYQTRHEPTQRLYFSIVLSGSDARVFYTNNNRSRLFHL